MIETKVSAAKKEITSQVRKDLWVLKERLHGIENILQDQFLVASQIETDDLKAQLAEL